MFSINLRSRVAIYEQIVAQVEDGILKGLLKAGEQLPSVRGLSMELTLNPNTVSRAYTELERRGIIYSVVGKGSFVSENAQRLIAQKYSQTFSDFYEQVKNYRAAGISKQELIDMIEKIYRVEENEND